MTTPAFNVARQIGNNFDTSFRRVNDENAIEGILSQAMSTGDPKVMEGAIGKILSQVSPERQGPAIQYLQQAYTNIENKRAQQQIQQQATQQNELKRQQQLQDAQSKFEQQKELEGLKQAGKKDIENLKLTGKKELAKGKIDAIDALLGIDNNQPSGQVDIPPETMLRKSESNPKNVSDKQILKLTAIDPNLGKVVQQQKDSAVRAEDIKSDKEQKQFNSDREFHTKTSQPIIAKASAITERTPIDKGLIAQQRRDIASGNTSGIIPFLVEATGAEIYRNPESARFKTASKQRFVETVSELGASNARANQYIEQQLVAAQPLLGRSQEANDTVLDLEDFVLDMKSQRAKYELELAEQDEQRLGYARNDISRRADKLMKDYAEKRQDQMAYSIRNRHENNLDDKELTLEIMSGKVSPDTPLTPRVGAILRLMNNDNVEEAIRQALKLGFTVPKRKNVNP